MHQNPIARRSLPYFIALLVPAALATAQTTVPGGDVDTARFPEAGAVILSWDQDWTLLDDGRVRRREHKLIQLLERRAIRAVADPRIDFCDGREQITIHRAQTILPGGKTVAVPEYSFNFAAANDVAGWPEYACWRQQVVSFSAIEPGVVLELDYEVITNKKETPWLTVDLKLDHAFPVLSRAVSVTLPKDVTLHHRSDNTPGTTSPTTTSLDDGTTKYAWAFANLPADPGEPQSLPWPGRSPRLRFTTCPRAKVWVSELLVSVENAVQPSGAVQAFAEKVVGDEPDPAEKARLLSKKLRDVFNFVASFKTVRTLRCRSVAQVLDTNYGSPLESAALLVGMLRAVHVKATTEVAVDTAMWDADVPTDAGFAGIVVVIDVPDGPMYVHPQHGEFLNPGHWGGHTLLSLDTAEDLRATLVLARGQNEKSRLSIAGQLTVGPDGQVNGELRVHLTGGFYDPLRLRKTDKQKALLEGLVGRLLADFKITKHSITTLSDDSLKATVEVAAEKLSKVGDHFVLQFGEGPLFLTSGFPLPIGGDERKTSVRTRGALIENIDLILELPQDWPAPTGDTKLVRESGDWGVVVQERIASGHTIRFRRTIDIPTDTLKPADFADLRQAINTLRTIRHTHLLIAPKP